MKRIVQSLEFTVTEEKAGERLDNFLVKAYPELSRTYIKKLIEEGFVLVEGQRRKPSYRVRKGEEVLLNVPEPESFEVEAEDIPLDIIYEDEDIVVLIKPCGLVVHPSPGYSSGTLVNALLYHIGKLSSTGGVDRPGIVHRLDKETAGLMVVAKNDRAHRSLVQQFATRKTEKLYRALVKGIPRQRHGLIELPIGRHPVDRKRFSVRAKTSKPAKTEFWVLEEFKWLDMSLLKVKIYTGRTHQIRVHLSSIGHPIVGDTTYGFKKSSAPAELLPLLGECNMLVAYRLGFYHPTRGNWVVFEIEDPQPFRGVLEKVRELQGSLG